MKLKVRNPRWLPLLYGAETWRTTVSNGEHHKEDTDLVNSCLNPWCLKPELKPPVINGWNNLHVRCRLNRRSDRDAGDGLVTLSASQLTVLHDKP